MYILTQEEDSIESGTYATIDGDGTMMVQFFVDKDDAMSYNELLGAVGYDLKVTETPDEHIDKICDMLGYAYSIVEPGEVIFPRVETYTEFIS